MICLLREWSTRPACRPPLPILPACFASRPPSAHPACCRMPRLLGRGKRTPWCPPRCLRRRPRASRRAGMRFGLRSLLLPKNTSFSDDLEAFASDYGLTRREAEVVPCIYKGRSAKVIASTLCVSESTVRTTSAGSTRRLKSTPSRSLSTSSTDTDAGRQVRGAGCQGAPGVGGKAQKYA